MRWWRGIVLGLVFVGIVQPGCGGRSSNVEQEGESGSAGAGRTGANAGRSSGSGGSQAGRDDVVPGTGGATLLPQGGDAGRGGFAGIAGKGGFAGKGGSPGSGGSAGDAGGGVGGEPECPCADLCEESVDNFCHAGLPEIGCPLRLDAARELERYCESDAQSLVYSDCDGIVTISYYEVENDYELAFSKATGKLVYGHALLDGSPDCAGSHYGAGTRPDLQQCRSCSYCSALGGGGAGSDDEMPRCELDQDGLVRPPPNNVCECVEEECVLSPGEFCPNKLPYTCPVTLEAARQAEALCDASEEGIQYGECEGDIAIVHFEGSEESTTLGFDLESGELVLGRAQRYAYDYCSEASSFDAYLRTGPELDLGTCRRCDMWNYCTGEGEPDCVVDEAGRVSLPD